MKPTFIPHDYQNDITDWIQNNRRCAVWAGMGTGKTASTLLALDHLSLVEEDVYPVLVLAPLRVARSTWPDEIDKWSNFEHLKVSVIAGPIKERERALKAKAHIYTVNYENLQWLVTEYLEGWPFKTVVADEFTRLKGYRTRQGSQRAKALSRVAHQEVQRFIGLTGTPSPNGLTDLWGQTWFLDRGLRLGKTFAAFESRWFAKSWDGHSLKPHSHSQKEIEGKLKDICLTVSGLPVDAPIINDLVVDLPPSARNVYDELETAFYADLPDDLNVTAANGGVLTGKLQQAASGAIYTDEGKGWLELHRAKIEVLESIIEEASGAPVLVAYQFKSDLERLKAAFPKARVLDTNPKTIREWNDGKIEILLAHPKSAGHGLNLAKGGNILAFFTPNWNSEEHDQIIERIGPMRQKQAGIDRPVFILRIIAKNTVDELILERLRTKRSLQDVLLDAMNRRKKP